MFPYTLYFDVHVADCISRCKFIFASNYGPQKIMKKYNNKMQLWDYIQFAQDSNRFESFIIRNLSTPGVFTIDTERERVFRVAYLYSFSAL